MNGKETKTVIYFLLPLILFISFFILIPVIGTLWNSFWQDVTYLPKRFTGITNYVRVFQDAKFGRALLFTLIFSFISVSLELILGLTFALVINQKFRLRGIMRGIMLLPWAIPSVISARTWQIIYQYNFGLANYLSKKIIGVPINWLGSSTGALFSLVLADVWRTTSFVTIILLAGLQTIPDELYEQAKIDGANMFQQFTKLTLPLLKPIITVALLFRTIDALRVFDVIYVITGGGPGGSSTSVSLYAYKYFLSGDFGYGATISIILFFVALAVSITYIKVSNFKDEIL